MPCRRPTRLLIAGLLGATCLAAASAAQDRPAPSPDPLAEQFRDPPQSARPRVWWHWMNGNITKDGIAKDLEWMKRSGIGGLQNFDANLTTPQVVDHRLVYMTPEWKDAFRFAAGTADRLGLEMAIAASPGWSETGGPWVKPEDGLKKLVWSETTVAGGKPFAGRLPAPPSVTGPFQSLPMARSIEEMIAGPDAKAPPKPTYYSDIAVLAFPVAATRPAPAARVTTVEGAAIDAGSLTDDRLDSAVEVAPGTRDKPGGLVLAYDAPRTIRSATIFVPEAKTIFTPALYEPVLEASDDGASWRRVAVMPLGEVPTTVSFAPVTARRFRLVLAPNAAPPPALGEPAPGAVAPPFFAGAGGPKPVHVGELRLSEEPRVDRFEEKAGFAIARDYYALSRGVLEQR